MESTQYALVKLEFHILNRQLFVSDMANSIIPPFIILKLSSFSHNIISFLYQMVLSSS